PSSCPQDIADMLQSSLVQPIELLTDARLEILPHKSILVVPLARDKAFRDLGFRAEFQEVEEQRILARVEHLTVFTCRDHAMLYPLVVHAIHKLVGRAYLCVAFKIV